MTCWRRYPGEVTTAIVTHHPERDEIVLTTIKEDVNRVQHKRMFKQVLEKWIMKDIRSNACNREFALSDEEHAKFIEAISKKDGQAVIRKLKSKKVNTEVDNVLDHLIKNVIKVREGVKNPLSILKTEDLSEDEESVENINGSARSLAISVRDMYEALVENKIIKTEQPINV